MHILHLFLCNGVNPICVIVQVKHPCSKTPTTVGTTEPTTEGTTEGTTEPTTEPAKCGKFLKPYYKMTVPCLQGGRGQR